MPAPPRLRRRRAEPRLDPVRWRRPARGTLLRLIAAAALLTVGVLAAWSPQPACAPPTAATVHATGVPTPGGGSAQPTPEPAPAGTAAAGERPGDRQSGHPVPLGRVGVPVRLAEPTALTLLHPGDRVDLLRVDGTGRSTSTVATGAPVLDVTGAGDPTAGGLLLALRPDEARAAVAAHGPGFAVLIRPD